MSQCNDLYREAKNQIAELTNRLNDAQAIIVSLTCDIGALREADKATQATLENMQKQFEEKMTIWATNQESFNHEIYNEVKEARFKSSNNSGSLQDDCFRLAIEGKFKAIYKKLEDSSVFVSEGLLRNRSEITRVEKRVDSLDRNIGITSALHNARFEKFEKNIFQNVHAVESLKENLMKTFNEKLDHVKSDIGAFGREQAQLDRCMRSDIDNLNAYVYNGGRPLNPMCRYCGH